MKKGFTLIELSIVLVIIGLLVGGILVGQSLVDSVKLSSFVRQIQQFDILAQNFKAKYKQLPGDTKILSGHIGPGNNDGHIRCCGGGWNDDAVQGEVLNYWYHLSQMGNLQKQYTYLGATSGLIAGTHMPEMAIGDGVGIFVGQEREAANIPFDDNINFYWIAKFPTASNNVYACNDTTCVNPFDTVTSLAIDKKMDDGVINTGDVRATGAREFGNNQRCFSYNPSSTAKCSLAIRYLSQVSQ